MSVVIATMGRDSACRAVRSVLVSEGVDLELVVVDQSPDGLMASVLGELVGDERLVVVHSETVGVSRGRNVGLRRARHDVVLITDDDVTVPPDWAQRFHAEVSGARGGRGGVLSSGRRSPRPHPRLHS